MKQTDWKIIYQSYQGLQKKAVDLLSKEAGKYLIREQKRENKSIIFENDYGTYVFTSYIDNHINHLAKLDENHVTMVLFDDNFVDPKLFEKVINYITSPKGLFVLSEGEADTYE